MAVSLLLIIVGILVRKYPDVIPRGLLERSLTPEKHASRVQKSGLGLMVIGAVGIILQVSITFAVLISNHDTTSISHDDDSSPVQVIPSGPAENGDRIKS